MFRCMTDITPLLLDEDALEQAAPAVRALTLQRLEKIWQQVEDHLDPDLGADPRWAEIGLRVLDREARLYRLDKPAKVAEDSEDEYVGVDRGQLLLEQLDAVRARLGGPERTG
jgi:hypothetical protein